MVDFFSIKSIDRLIKYENKVDLVDIAGKNQFPDNFWLLSSFMMTEFFSFVTYQSSSHRENRQIHTSNANKITTCMDTRLKMQIIKEIN